MDPIEQQAPQPVAQNPQDVPPVKKGINRKVLLLVGAVVLALVVIGVLAFILLSSQNQPQGSGQAPPPEPENVLLATVGERQIYRKDVVDVALEQYTQSGINSQIMKLALDIAVERAILDAEAEEKQIVVTDAPNKIEYYERLKGTIIAREIGSVDANVISYWVPAFGDIYPQKPEYQQMRDLTQEVLGGAVEELRAGRSTYEIGSEIVQKYPVFKDQLAVNSYILSKVSDTSLMTKPITYQYIVNDSNKLFLDTLFAMNPDQIRLLVWPDGEGAAVIQVVNKNTGDKVSYDQWLESRKEGVTFIEENIAKI